MEIVFSSDFGGIATKICLWGFLQGSSELQLVLQATA